MVIEFDKFKDGINQEDIINFFNFLYRHCEPGFLQIFVLTFPGVFDTAEKLSFKIPEEVEKIPEIFEKFKKPIHLPWFYTPRFYFRLHLFDRQGEISSIPCFWIDLDDFTSDIEAKLNTFNPPSVVLQTSPQHFHLFWMLK
jgi:hypothetical protein